MVSCSAFYDVYMFVIFLYPSENDGEPHRSCSVARVNRVPSTFLRKL